MSHGSKEQSGKEFPSQDDDSSADDFDSRREIDSQSSNEGASSEKEDGSSTVIFVALLSLALAGIIFEAYSSTLQIGFLLDDFQHVDYVARAFAGDSAELFHRITRNWSGQTDAMTSFRPLISLSFCLDYLFYGVKATGYHLTNLLMYWGCSVLVALLGYELSRGAHPSIRKLGAVIGGAIFALYPIHPEAVAWVIGRVDVQCTLFYLATLYLYARHRSSTSLSTSIYRSPLLLGAYATFLLSLMSKEMSVTLPIAVALMEALCAKPLEWKGGTFKRRCLVAGSFLLVLVGFAVLRTLCLRTVVGGYGSGSLKEFLRSFRNFLDLDTFKKALFGVNEHFSFSSGISRVAFISWALFPLAAVWRLATRTASWRVMLFVFGWLLISQLPTFQIWHIYPNLVGSRLFFLGSSALCVLVIVTISSFPLSAGEPRWRVVLNNYTSWFFVVVTMVLCTVCGIALRHNLQIWEEAGRQVQTIPSSIEKISSQLRSAKKILLLDIPQDYCGAGLVGRPEFIRIMLSPPMMETDLSARVVTMRDTSPDSRETFYGERLQTLMQPSDVGIFLKWDTKSGNYSEWNSSVSEQSDTGRLLSGASDTSPRLALPEVPTVISGEPKDIWLCDDGKSGSVDDLIDPLKIGVISIDAKLEGESIPGEVHQQESLEGRIELLWTESASPVGFMGPLSTRFGDKQVIVCARSVGWILGGPKSKVGLRVSPGENSVVLRAVSSSESSEFFPELRLFSNESSGSHLASSLKLQEGGTLRLEYSCASIADCAGVRVGIVPLDHLPSVQPTVDFPPASDLIATFDGAWRSGTLDLTSALDKLPSRRKFGVICLPLDASGKPAGFLSAPVLFTAP